VVGGGVVRADRGGALEERDRVVGPTGLTGEHAQPVEGVGVTRICGDELAVTPGGLAHAAGAVVFQSQG
jgi:hypothetical protein